jgi:hypothetical protein
MNILGKEVIHNRPKCYAVVISGYVLEVGSQREVGY